MPVTLQTTTLKYKNSQGIFQEAACLKGTDGISIPAGGTTGQILRKASNTDYDAQWTAEQTIEMPDLTDYIKNTDIASDATPGIVRVAAPFGISLYNNILQIATATDTAVKTGTSVLAPITPSNEHAAAFYGLAKAAGDSTQAASENAVGTYTNDAKAAIRTMLGVPSTSDIPTVPVQDVTIDGTSILSSGTAVIPKAGTNNYGVVKINEGNGISIGSTSGTLMIYKAQATHVKSGTNDYLPLTPSIQHTAVFYGLAKAAGDTTQSQSDNAVGTYTNGAKSAIKTMLDIHDTLASVDVSGTTPTITALANTIYVCGEVLSLDITPCATGTCEIIFTSGSSATVLTLPNTVKMPAWFAVEANMIYDIIITNCVYGAVMSWAA